MRTTPKYLAATAALAMVALTVFARGTPAQNASGPSPSVTSADDNASPILRSPIYGVTIPAGYRQWELIAPSHEAILDELRGILGNDVAIKAYREAALPFPDGTILAKVAWKHVPSVQDNGALGKFQAFVPRARHDSSDQGQGFQKVRFNGRLGIRAIHQRQASR
jgi:Cytochrome P460